jgi:hypothetical protein
MPPLRCHTNTYCPGNALGFGKDLTWLRTNLPGPDSWRTARLDRRLSPGPSHGASPSLQAERFPAGCQGHWLAALLQLGLLMVPGTVADLTNRQVVGDPEAFTPDVKEKVGAQEDG